ncbi:MAG: hypothetical protein ABIM99_06485 [Candidatus Dojkabacteria bacterium]
MKDRIGYYCWAGPDTIKMTKLKFFNPGIDEQSLMSSYDLEYLMTLKEKFGITDFWATYSWGFSEESEKEQYEFLLSKLKNFKKAGIKIHAYVQGTNVVTADFKDKDWFCKDEYGRDITYYRGRKVVCVNNPGFVNFILTKIESMHGLKFDGIFVDNIQMGQIPIPDFDGKGIFTFAGCKCKYCDKKYFNLYQKHIPRKMQGVNGVRYFNFRVNCTSEFIEKLSSAVHRGGFEFGTNSFDPKFDTKALFGTDIKRLEKLQDYLLFENHSLPGKKTNNEYIHELIKKNNITKPVFVVSYKKGIGYDSEFTQSDFNNIYSEDKQLDFFAAIKGSEYFTNGKWHNLRLNEFNKPQIDESEQFRVSDVHNYPEMLILRVPFLKNLLRKYYNPIYRLRMESRLFRKVMYIFTQMALR